MKKIIITALLALGNHYSGLPRVSLCAFLYFYARKGLVKSFSCVLRVYDR